MPNSAAKLGALVWKCCTVLVSLCLPWLIQKGGSKSKMVAHITLLTCALEKNPFGSVWQRSLGVGPHPGGGVEPLWPHGWGSPLLVLLPASLHLARLL